MIGASCGMMQAGVRRARGAALVLVLWLIALLTALIGAFALTARIEGMQGRVLGDGAEGQQLARAGVEYAMQRVADSDPERHWIPDGRAYPWRFADASLQVRIVDESGKVDLNQADAALLAALLRALGESRESAERMAGVILDWRDGDSLSQPSGGAEDADYAAAGLPYGAKDAPFESVDEARLLLGMTPELYTQLAPVLTVHGMVQPNPAYAPGPVLTALGLDAAELLARREAPIAVPVAADAGSGTYSIESRARLRDGREAVLRVVLRNGGGNVPGAAYTVLRWEEGASSR
jgi:general secretion pathway protein K